MAERKRKWGRVIGKRQRKYSLRLNTERWVLCFIHNECRENEGKKSRTKMEMREYIKFS
jgi:hypothetical protein